jgi:hypothetical protein
VAFEEAVVRADVILMVTATYQELLASCAEVGEVIIRDTDGNDVVRLNREAMQRFEAPVGFARAHISIFFHAANPNPVRKVDMDNCNCCDRAGEYNGYASGPLLFVCPKSCPCHD